MTDWRNLPAPGGRYAEVIGDPIAHSKSPFIHGRWLAEAGIDARYRAVLVKSGELPAYFAHRTADPDWAGCNVTVPHKEAVLAHVPDPFGVRESIGAANTIFRRGDGSAPACTNTDAAGFWTPVAGFPLGGRPLAVIGAGGAARAVLFALSRPGSGAGPVTLLNRSPLKGAALLSRFGLAGRALPLDAPLPSAAMVVNASPLGMTGQPRLDLDLSPLPDDCLVYDLVYAPLETPLLRAARERGLDVLGGLEMLVAQAAVAFELFFGREPPRDRDEELMELLAA